MSASIRCVCGKDNIIVDDGLTNGMACLRCNRPLMAAAVRPVVADAAGRLVPVEPEVNRAGHPGAVLEPPVQSTGIREYLYWLLPLAILPLAYSLGQPVDDTEARFRRTLHESPPHVRKKVEQLEHDPFATIDDIFDVLPNNMIIGAFVPRDSTVHWWFAGLATAAFLAVAVATFPKGGADPRVLVAVGLFTATGGIMLLLIVQPFFTFNMDDVLDDTKDFWISLFGYIFGVGLFEELAKLVPVWWRIRRIGAMRWRAACLWGLASGGGFGVAEGIFYSQEFYNGVSTMETYFVRFFSCVALHAIWSASAALSLSRVSNVLTAPTDKAVYAAALLRVIAIPAILHGLYDAVLQYGYDELALAAAAVSFGWLAYQIETTRAACAPAPAEPEPAKPDLAAAVAR
jgi:RsiW-degrading membrane proteinase PrsW (M82 family)